MLKKTFAFWAFTYLAFAFSLFIATNFAQKNNEQWLRTITEEGFLVEVSRWSLSLPQINVISAKFKTTLEKQESVPENVNLKYQSRFDLIEFNIKTKQYRISQSTFIDGSEKPVFSSTGAKNWKPIDSHIGRKLFSAAGQLSPFGYWKVLSYRYASGDTPSRDDPPELTSLVGSYMRLDLTQLMVGKESCDAPSFELKTISNESFKKLTDDTLDVFGITTDKAEAIVLRCESSKNNPVQTFVLRLPNEKALMLWEGVLLEIERPGNLFKP